MNNYTLSDLFLARFRHRKLVCSIRKIGDVIKEIRASKGGEVYCHGIQDRNTDWDCVWS